MSERTAIVDMPDGDMVRYADFPAGNARVALRVGEMLTFAAQKHGVALDLPHVALEDHWASLHSANVMGALRLHGDNNARQVLKEVRKQVNEGTQGQDTKKELLEHVGQLMRSLRGKQPKMPGNLPMPEGFQYVPARPIKPSGA